MQTENQGGNGRPLGSDRHRCRGLLFVYPPNCEMLRLPHFHVLSQTS